MIDCICLVKAGSPDRQSQTQAQTVVTDPMTRSWHSSQCRVSCSMASCLYFCPNVFLLPCAVPYASIFGIIVHGIVFLAVFFNLPPAWHLIQCNHGLQAYNIHQTRICAQTHTWLLTLARLHVQSACMTCTCNVWNAHMISVIPMTATAVPISYNWFQILITGCCHPSVWHACRIQNRWHLCRRQCLIMHVMPKSACAWMRQMAQRHRILYQSIKEGLQDNADKGIWDTIAGAYNYTADGLLFSILRHVFVSLFHSGESKPRIVWRQC